ncbi:MAG TPA: kelch repeat-containing protein [Solirubrobacterales bacterium]|nr:kelch repeat-containing protein [Solirubrobacterales bacterium]
MRSVARPVAARRVTLACAIAAALAGLIAVAASGDESEAPPPERAGGGWSALAPSIFARTEVGAARIGRQIYVVGGFNAGGDTTSRVARYDIDTNRWRRVRRLPIAVNHAGVAALRGRLYVLGGNWPARGANAKSPRLYRYAPKRNRWQRLRNAPTARSAIAFAAIGRRLYAAGGSAAGNPRIRRLEVYHPRRNRWRRRAPMPTGRNHVAAAVVGKRLYVSGGRPGPVDGNRRTVESFAPGAGWRVEPALETARSGHTAAVSGGRMVAFGGEELGPGGETIAAVEMLAPGATAWTPLPDMVTPRHGLGGAARGNRVFALEGGPQPGLTVSRAVEALNLP